MIAGACNPAGALVDGCNEKPSSGDFDGSFEIRREAAVAVQPCDCPFDDPATWQKPKAVGVVGVFDNFLGPHADFW